MLTIAAVAYDPRVVTVWEGICDYLTGAGVPADYVLYRSYEAQVNALFARHVDVAWNTNLAYVRSQDRAGGQCRALAMRDTDLDWTTKIIVRPGAASSLADLRGKTLALGSRDSGHAAILPVHFLRAEGLEPERDYRPLRFDLDVGKHGDTGASEIEVLRAVLDGRADAGAVGAPFWARAIETGQVPRGSAEAIWTSPPYHHCMFTALPDFDPARADQFTRALFAMSYDDPAHRPVLDAEGLKQWLPPHTDGYGSLTTAARAAGLL
ncbi:MAG: phosphate/phosphite/phosphonate ABC transporter substrate-binding protein [Myxococcales bacterium]|nr:phosphate/phosphite/phosphonate ABC transporter substrate-binding protein [Myxococcales bacterium]